MTFPASDPPASTKPGSGVTGPCNAADTQRTQITVLKLRTDTVITIERPGARDRRKTRDVARRNAVLGLGGRGLVHELLRGVRA